MAGKDGKTGATPRRKFLAQMSAAAAVSGLALGRTARGDQKKLPAAAPLPTIKLGDHEISRLVAGWNPIGGHSHTTLNMARFMREYFTVERTTEFLLKCEHEGITAWQFDHDEKAIAALRAVREAGSKLKCFCLHAERAYDDPIKKVVLDTHPFACVHHGGVTDALFRADRAEKVHDYVKKVHDQGLLAGVSSHCPANIKRIADEGWEVDFFMTCFHYVTRPRDEQQKLLGKITVGEPFFESDPEEMTAVVRQVDKPCLGFKILAAGRKCWSTHSVESAFRFALGNIKPIDGVIVGMFPVYFDEVRANAELARKYGVV